MNRRQPVRAFALGIALAAVSIACNRFGPSKAQAKELVALSLSNEADLQFATFIGTFCESDDGRRLRQQGSAGDVPSNAYAFGRMADNRSLKTLIANGYVEAKAETLAPDAAEGRHPSCGTREVCPRCPVITKYYVTTYQLTPKGKDLFLVTPITENEFVTLYNSGPLSGPLEDVQQAFSDDMPFTISVAIGTKAFDVTQISSDFAQKTARVDYEWYWKATPRIEKTALKQMIPQGRNRASVSLKQMDDGWHLERDGASQSQ